MLEIYLRGGVAIRMVMFDVGDHQDIGRQTQEHAVIFIRFDHEIIAFARVRVLMQVLDQPANDIRRVHAELGKTPGDHGGGCGLAVRSGHRGHFLPAGQLLKEVHALQHRDAGFLGGDDLDIRIRDRGRANDRIRALT